MRRLEELPFEEVDDSWRRVGAAYRKRRKVKSYYDDTALVQSLLDGKTCRVSLSMDMEQAEKEYNQFKGLYNMFHSRGYRMRIGRWDTPDFHGLIVWLENFIVPRLHDVTILSD